MKILIRWIVPAIAALLVMAQFIRSPRNEPQGMDLHPMTDRYRIPPDINDIFRVACYDCHSDSTRYPWYANVQPVGWWLNSHIRDAQRGLNFSEFSSYPLRRQFGKFRDIVEQINKGEMPLSSYTLIHSDARLSKEQSARIVAWAESMMDTMKARYPADSLVRKQR